MDLDLLLKQSQELIVEYIPKIIGSLLILFIGLYVIKRIGRLLEITLNKSKADATLKPFLISLCTVTLKILLVITIIQMLGYGMTSFVAILGASGLAIGLAFQGALSNFAGGVLLLTLRPFKVGDFITASGYDGTVEAINVFNTVLVTPDNRVISIPNGNLSNTSVVNYNVKSIRRVDLNFGVGYEQDIDKVKSILEAVCKAEALVLKDPEPFIKVSEHGDSAVFFVVRTWVKTQDYWTVYFNLLETVKKEFDKENVSIPYPQMDIHMQQ